MRVGCNNGGGLQGWRSRGLGPLWLSLGARRHSYQPPNPSWVHVHGPVVIRRNVQGEKSNRRITGTAVQVKRTPALLQQEPLSLVVAFTRPLKTTRCAARCLSARTQSTADAWPRNKAWLYAYEQRSTCSLSATACVTVPGGHLHPYGAGWGAIQQGVVRAGPAVADTCNPRPVSTGQSTLEALLRCAFTAIVVTQPSERPT